MKCAEILVRIRINFVIHVCSILVALVLHFYLLILGAWGEMCLFIQTRLQAQAAGVPYDGFCQLGCFETSTVKQPISSYFGLLYDLFNHK